ncbi:domain of Kin17 curved DNA-binding protein-domain-containing protein, partial [Phlyctochytrium arcticum]
MGKDGGFLTPKAIANRIKAKGLQKLRWYCQMCEKQYRDENGFKQHCTSESHLRQMQLFADSPDKILGSYSKEFLQEFMKLLSKRYGTRRVHANLVYQEYISDRNHLHMNATHWASLSEFVKHLGRERLCNVEETEKGWFITWIDRSPETLAKQEAIQKKERMERSDEERARKALQEQMEKAQKQMQESGQAPTELKRDKAEEPIKLQMKTMFTAKPFKKLETKRLNALASTSKKSSPSLSSTPASPTP